MTAPYGHGWDDTDWDYADPADEAADRMVTVELPPVDDEPAAGGEA